MRACGIRWGALLLACGCDAARDPFQPPERATATSAAVSAVGIVGRTPCFLCGCAMRLAVGGQRRCPPHRVLPCPVH